VIYDCLILLTDTYITIIDFEMLSHTRIALFKSVCKSSRFLNNRSAVNHRFFQKKIRNVRDRPRVLSTVSFQEDESSMKWMKVLAGLSTMGAVLGSNWIHGDNKADCCGIAGVIGTEDNDAR
jgi:hypothetical protein